MWAASGLNPLRGPPPRSLCLTGCAAASALSARLVGAAGHTLVPFDQSVLQVLVLAYQHRVLQCAIRDCAAVELHQPDKQAQQAQQMKEGLAPVPALHTAGGDLPAHAGSGQEHHPSHCLHQRHRGSRLHPGGPQNRHHVQHRHGQLHDVSVMRHPTACCSCALHGVSPQACSQQRAVFCAISSSPWQPALAQAALQ